MKMDYGMIMLHNYDNTKRNHNKIKIKVKHPWEMPTGHREDRKDTSMDSRPKRLRTRNDIDRAWRDEYDM